MYSETFGAAIPQQNSLELFVFLLFKTAEITIIRFTKYSTLRP